MPPVLRLDITGGQFSPDKTLSSFLNCACVQSWGDKIIIFNFPSSFFHEHKAFAFIVYLPMQLDDGSLSSPTWRQHPHFG